MASYDGYLAKGFTADTVNRVTIDGLSTSIGTPPQWTDIDLYDETTALILDPTPLAGTKSVGTISAPVTNYYGYLDAGVGGDFFEHIIILDRSYALGVILSEIERDIEIYNAYREDSQELADFTNDCDAGVSIPDLPSLPATIGPQDGIVGTLTVSTQGPPVLDGYLIFTFTTLGDFSIPVTGERAIMIPILPETPMNERMEFKTDVIVKLTGAEQRIALRDTPRQTFDAIYRLDGHDRRALLPILFDAQGRAAGFPLWHEPTWTTTAISASDTVVHVESTEYADWRADGIGIVWTDSENYEALEVASYTGTTITFKSAFQNAFAAGAMVMPVRTAFFEATIRGTRALNEIQTLQIRYLVLDDDVDLSDDTAFSTYRSKVFLDEANWVDRELTESLGRPMERVDGDVGSFMLYSDWDASRRTSRKVFFCGSRQRLWEVRQLLHALRGRAISFYLSTFYPDLEPTAGITDSATTMKIKHIKYTDLVRERSPKGDIQVLLTDGTTIDRQITDSTELSATEEQITVSTAWGTTATLDEIARVSFIEKVRFDSDEILLEHTGVNGQARVSAPVKTVLE